MGTDSGARRAGAPSVTAGPLPENTCVWDNQAGPQRGPGQRTVSFHFLWVLCGEVQNNPGFHNSPALFSRLLKMECPLPPLSLSFLPPHLCKIACLRSASCNKIRVPKGKCLLCPLLYPQHVWKCLAPNRYRPNSCWMNEWLFFTFQLQLSPLWGRLQPQTFF